MERTAESRSDRSLSGIFEFLTLFDPVLQGAKQGGAAENPQTGGTLFDPVWAKQGVARTPLLCLFGLRGTLPVRAVSTLFGANRVRIFRTGDQPYFSISTFK